MDKKDEVFIDLLKTKIKEEGIETIEDEGIKTVIRHMEKEKSYLIKDYERIRAHFKSILYYMDSTDNRTGDYKIIQICEYIIVKMLERRRKRERKFSKVDLNIITHAPYFVGGGKKRKAMARDEGYVLIEKEGIRSVTYENNLGEFLSTPDAQVLFALFSIWEEQKYREWISFTEYQIIKLVGLSNGGKQYQLVRDSLEKLWNTSIVMQEAYNVDDGTKEVTERFRLIEADRISKEYSKKGSLKSKRYEIKFSENVRKSMEGRYYTLISLAIFNELELNVSQGLYLMIMGLYDMEDSQKYVRDDGSVAVSTEEVYGTLYLESKPYRNRGMVERGCEELKEVGVLDGYYFNYEGRSAKELVLTPSSWLQEVIKKSTLQKRDLYIK